MNIYSDKFYKEQVDFSHQSARVYFGILAEHLKINSIIDIGCGRGAWLKAFKEQKKIDESDFEMLGVDGPWNSQDDMLEESIKYISCDLENISSLEIERKFDLAMSVEVAEHLQPSATEDFIDKLCNLSDVVMFSAAYKGQGGLSHKNERLHSEWASFFLKREYLVYDIFRPMVWGNSKVKWWYQQNIFLYVKKGSELHEKFQRSRLFPVFNVDFVNCVHSTLYAERNSFLGVLKKNVQLYLPASLVLFLSRLKSTWGGN